MRHLFGNFLWFWSSERIVFLIIFPLNVWLFTQNYNLLGVLCSALTFMLITFRRTIGNIRTIEFRRAKLREQRKRDTEAKKIFDVLKSGADAEVEPFVLFLRSFSADTQVRARARKNDVFDKFFLSTRISAGLKRQKIICFKSSQTRNQAWDLPTSNSFNQYETSFNESSAIYFYNEPGAIEIPDNSWFEEFSFMARKANLIFIMPLDCVLGLRTKSTLEEIKYIFQEGLEEKCVFFMPPNQQIIVDGLEEKSVSSLWRQTKEKIESLGFHFPKYYDSQNGTNVFLYKNQIPKLFQLTMFQLKRLDYSLFWAMVYHKKSEDIRMGKL